DKALDLGLVSPLSALRSPLSALCALVSDLGPTSTTPTAWPFPARQSGLGEGHAVRRAPSFGHDPVARASDAAGLGDAGRFDRRRTCRFLRRQLTGGADAG